MQQPGVHDVRELVAVAIASSRVILMILIIFGRLNVAYNVKLARLGNKKGNKKRQAPDENLP